MTFLLMSTPFICYKQFLMENDSYDKVVSLKIWENLKITLISKISPITQYCKSLKYSGNNKITHYSKEG